MKILLTGVLIIAMVLVALTLPMVGGMALCPGCLSGNAGHGFGLCAGMLSVLLSIVALSFSPANRTLRPNFKEALPVDSLLRPPRVAVGL